MFYFESIHIFFYIGQMSIHILGTKMIVLVFTVSLNFTKLKLNSCHQALSVRELTARLE